MRALPGVTQAGRAIRDEDDANAPPVAVVSERFAKHFFGTVDPIGHQLDVGRRPRWHVTIVGVAKDLRHQSPRKEPERTIYLSSAQSLNDPRAGVLVRSALPPAVLMPTVRRAVRDTSPDVDVPDMKMLTRELDERLLQERLLATLSGFFGIVALLLAAIGLYGLLAACGLLAGLAASFWTTRLVAGVLFGLTPTDAGTMLLAAGLLLASAVAAGLIPARRAALVDPLTALRHE